MDTRHILICGEIGAGKSTLITRLLSENKRPVSGFITKRLETETGGFHPIYIHPASDKPREYGEQNLVGLCDRRTHDVRLACFNTLGVAYLSAEPGGLIVMDELGFMEAKAGAFTAAVLRALDGDIPVIAAVKARYDVPFLNTVRAHPNAALYTLTKDNRESLCETLIPVIRAWNGMHG